MVVSLVCRFLSKTLYTRFSARPLNNHSKTRTSEKERRCESEIMTYKYQTEIQQKKKKKCKNSRVIAGSNTKALNFITSLS